MTDQEIIELAYEYANCFTSGMVFKDDKLVEFARAVIAAYEIAPSAQPAPLYEDAFTAAYIKMIHG